MADDPNPYESPLPVGEHTPPTQPPPRDTWKFVLLGIAILGGLVSFVPWLALIFAAISAPLFLRYSITSRRSNDAGTPETIARTGADAFGLLGMTISIFAASAGAFLGTCTLTGWGTGLTGISAVIARLIYTNQELADIGVSFYVGIAAGSVAFLFALGWLWWRNRLFPFRPNSRDSGDILQP